MTDEDPLTTQQLADKIGCSRDQISVWHRGPYGMPQPVGAVEGHRGRRSYLWDWPAIEDWLIKTDRWDPIKQQRTMSHRQRPLLPETERWAAKRAWAIRMGWT